MALTQYEMLQKAEKVFAERLARDGRIQNLLSLMRDGRAEQRHAQEYAQRIGYICSTSLRSVIGDVAELPGGVMPADYAEYLLTNRLRSDYSDIVAYADAVQNTIYADQGLGIQALDPAFPSDRLSGLVEKITGSTPEELEVWFGEPVTNFDMSVFDKWVETNVEACWNAGFSAKIVRTTGPATTKTYKQIYHGKKGNSVYTVTKNLPCKLCTGVAGTYDYGNHPDDIFKRHAGCRCVVLYVTSNRVEDVWTHKEAEEDIKRRAAYGLDLTRL